MSLDSVAAFIKKHKHLPDVPPAYVVETEGLKLDKMNATLMKKVEELTLNVLQMQR